MFHLLSLGPEPADARLTERVSTAQTMLRLTKETVKTQLRAVSGVLVYRDSLEVSLMQFYCCQRLLVELGAEAAEDGFQLCTQSCWREALLRRQRRKGFVAVRLVQGLEDRRWLEACRSEWKHDGSKSSILTMHAGRKAV